MARVFGGPKLEGERKGDPTMVKAPTARNWVIPGEPDARLPACWAIDQKDAAQARHHAVRQACGTAACGIVPRSL